LMKPHWSGDFGVSGGTDRERVVTNMVARVWILSFATQRDQSARSSCAGGGQRATDLTLSTVVERITAFETAKKLVIGRDFSARSPVRSPVAPRSCRQVSGSQMRPWLDCEPGRVEVPGATGLEPATSGVTGLFQGNDEWRRPR